MPLVKPVLAAAIEAALAKQAAKVNKGDDPKVAAKELASDIATAVDSYIKTALVTVTGVSATGGPVTGTGIIS
jgi:hypothetical protein